MKNKQVTMNTATRQSAPVRLALIVQSPLFPFPRCAGMRVITAAAWPTPRSRVVAEGVSAQLEPGKAGRTVPHPAERARGRGVGRRILGPAAVRATVACRRARKGLPRMGVRPGRGSGLGLAHLGCGRWAVRVAHG